MTPALPKFDGRNGDTMHSIPIRNTALCTSCCTNITNILLGKFSPSVILSTIVRTIPPTLSSLILHVVHMGSKKQMAEVATRRVVALVQNHHFFRNLPIGKNPSHTVHALLFSFNFDYPISILVFAPLPLDASRRHQFGVLFKICFKVYNLCSHVRILPYVFRASQRDNVVTGSLYYSGAA